MSVKMDENVQDATKDPNRLFCPYMTGSETPTVGISLPRDMLKHA